GVAVLDGIDPAGGHGWRVPCCWWLGEEEGGRRSGAAWEAGRREGGGEPHAAGSPGNWSGLLRPGAAVDLAELGELFVGQCAARAVEHERRGLGEIGR